MEDDADYEISADDLQQWESRHGTHLKPLVILWTGWASRWTDKDSYIGTATKNPTLLHFPGIVTTYVLLKTNVISEGND